MEFYKVVSRENAMSIHYVVEEHVAPIGWVCKGLEKSLSYPALWIGSSLDGENVYYVHIDDLERIEENEDFAAAGLLKEEF